MKLKTIGMCDTKITQEIIKEIADIIWDIKMSGYGDNYIYYEDAEDAAIAIMKKLQNRGCF